MLKLLIKILLCGILMVATYFVHNRWIETKEIGIEGFFLLLSASAFLGYELIGVAYKRGLLKQTGRTNLLLMLATVTVVLILTELSLRFFAPNLESWFEKNNKTRYRTYRSAYRYYIIKCDSCDGRYEYVCGPHVSNYYTTSEFSYMHSYNGYGLRDHEFNLKKDSNEFRILALGDSFVEGVGTTVDSTWIKQLESLLNNNPGPVRYTTINAGVHGSDLFFSYELLTRCLLKYKPDLVILNLNSTDNGEDLVRGDFERFDSAGNFHFKQGPWWEFIFGSSYIARLFALDLLHYTWSLRAPWQLKEDRNEGLEVISKKISDYYRLSQRLKFNFLLVLQPMQDEFPTGENFIHALKIDPVVSKIDLTPNINDSINVHPPKSRYYWPKDGHFTGVGYGLEATLIYKKYFIKHD